MFTKERIHKIIKIIAVIGAIGIYAEEIAANPISPESHPIKLIPQMISIRYNRDSFLLKILINIDIKVLMIAI